MPLGIRRNIVLKLIKSTNYWNCSLAAAAMVMEESIETLEKLIGHNGSKVINTELKSPGNRKGFHAQELIGAALALNYAMVPIEAVPVQTATGVDKHEIKFINFDSSEERFSAFLDGTKGILMGKSPSRYWHAVAHDDGTIYDPIGTVYALDDIKIAVQLYWLFLPIKSKSF